MSHDKISPTADLVAFWRSFSDIPYAKEIAELAKTRETTFELFKKHLPNLTPKDLSKLIDKITFSFGAPMIEVRYKALDECIKKSRIKNIYEIAAGISPRGIIFTEDSKIKYFATDLPNKVKFNEKILSEVMKKHNLERNNLYFYPVNALDESQFLSIGDKLEGPVCIVHEGLLLYLNREEKFVLGSNIKKLLEKKGGCWITPDLARRDKMEARMAEKTKKEREMFSFVMSVIIGVSERDMLENAFESEEDIDSFFNSLGFQVEKFPQCDGNFNVFSLKDESEKNKAMKFIRDKYVYVISLRGS